MEANELRIGNFTEQGIVRTFYESGIHVGYGACFNYSEVEPVLLTVDRLSLFGYRVFNNRKYIGINVTMYYIPGDPYGYIEVWDCNDVKEFKFSLNDNSRYVAIKHLHQLQNLYFALTGNELQAV